MQLFVDLDGVLCDFIGGFKKKFGVSFFDVKEEDAWKMVKAQPNLWLELDPFPGAIEFFNDLYIRYRYPPMILTAVPKSSFIESSKNKKAWVRKYLGDIIVVPCIGGYNKAAYIQNLGDILIDDMYEKNLVPWNAHGGVGIHHVEGSSYTTTYDKFVEVSQWILLR
jgi:hypothetical protein